MEGSQQAGPAEKTFVCKSDEQLLQALQQVSASLAQGSIDAACWYCSCRFPNCAARHFFSIIQLLYLPSSLSLQLIVAAD
jgi:hypothetical protein